MKWMLAFTIFFSFTSINAQRKLGIKPTDSGGKLMAEQACYDVRFYDLSLKVEPAEQSIAGVLTARAVIVQPTEWFVMDLDTLLSIQKITEINRNGETIRSFERRGWKVWIALGTTRQPGSEISIAVTYGGKPRVAQRPPWVGGFIWNTTKDGQPWIGVACQNDGADIWWPCKDHPSDEPDSMSLHITVPISLLCIANGRDQGVVKNSDSTHTFHWYVTTPINNYGVSINIAPYKKIEGSYTSITGQVLPIAYWVLPENYEKGLILFKQIPEHLRFHEKLLGPYPFRTDKYAVVETPYLGMEHQTVIAYGNNYTNNPFGFDFLHHHELSHEWWGNLVTAVDWSDIWIHEGFGAYMQHLYAGELKGEKAYHESLAALRPRIRNMKPVAERRALTINESYLVAPDFVESDGDNYTKGTWILHTLRYLIGDDAFFKSLRRMTYPDSAMEKITNGKQCRFVSTDDYLATVESITGRKFDWFFEVYFRRAQLPKLISTIEGNKLLLRWETPDHLPFPMPVTVQLGQEKKQIAMPDGKAEVIVPKNIQPVIDPDQWLLMD
ncbi:M1 family metallopeptidase [bacterium]|nr:M1 family metallopeptidase [bacterium]